MSFRVRTTGHAARSHKQRLDAIDRHSRVKQDSPQPGWLYWEETFSQATLAVQASGRYYPPFTGQIYEAVATLKDAPSSGTYTVVVKVNGGTQATFSLTSGEHYEKQAMDDVLQSDTDYATVETTALGAGASGLVVVLRFRRRA